MQRWQGTGESGVRLPADITRAIYRDEWTKGQIVKLCEELADKANVSMPGLEVLDGGTKRRWGTYFPRDKRITVYRRWPGILIHEFAHHIIKEKYPVSTPAHGPDYWHMCEASWSLAHDTVMRIATGVYRRRF